jgi:hypothetical protein
MADLKPYSAIAYDYMEWFTISLNKNHFTIEINSTFDTDNNLTGYYFTIKYPEINEDVGMIEIALFPNSSYTSSLRSKQQIPANIIYVSSIYIYNKFQGYGIATKLLLSALCYTYVNAPGNYTHVTLDDVTDSNIMSMDKNIYNRLGFVPTGLVELASVKKEMKVIRTEHSKMQTIDHIFQAIIHLKMKGGKRSKKRRHTIRRKHKKRRTVRK